MKKTIVTLSILTILLVNCKKKDNTPPPSGGGGTTTPHDTTLVDKVVLQNGKSAVQNNYINGVQQLPINQPTTIHISKAGTKGDSLIVETRTVYLKDSTTTTYIWTNPGNVVLGIDSFIYNKITKKVRYSNDCNGCGSGGANMKTTIETP